MTLEHKNAIEVTPENQKKKRAFLVSVYKDPKLHELCLEHLDELEFLSETFGVDPVGKMPCFIRRYDAATFVTKGKLEDLINRAAEAQAELVIFDDEMSPAQQRNLEKAFGIPVLDRTEVILEVFAQRAHTKEARLQIELAQARYQAPRLKRMWTHLSRQAGTAGGGGGGGGAYLKGVGEKQIEIDKRLIKKRINVLQEELEEVRAHRKTQRNQRQKRGIPVFAIIGYTNAGKSTLLNALTDAGVFVEDKLFATLDTTTRKFILKNNQEILLIDTVGFIRKLPHFLVAAFKSTLEESVEADILIHLVDASHPMALEQAATTCEVLEELGAADKPIITVLNKIDLIEDSPQITQIRLAYPKTIQISALKKIGFDGLQEMMIEEIKKQRKVVKLKIPQSDYHQVSEVLRVGRVLSQEYEENDVVMDVEIPGILADKLQKYLVPSS